MSYISKPKIIHPKRQRNQLGLTARDYEGVISTLCAGCGHDSITSAIVEAVHGMNIKPHELGKMSGIGCSSKTPAYFVSGSHGFNSVHGRMPSVTTGANAANPNLYYIGVSGDGDSLSIGMGQFAHAIRRNLNMCYLLENNGVYGLTKGQFSASADAGSTAKKGEENKQPPIDPVNTAITLGATFVARSFSGDKQQLIPLIQAALKHRGFALLDVISPCVTFNDHLGSTKSYAHTREFFNQITQTDYVAPRQEITVAYSEGEAMPIKLHDGSHIVLRKVDESYDPTDRGLAYAYLTEKAQQQEVVTGLLYYQKNKGDMHDVAGTVDTPLSQVPFDTLNPGKSTLSKIMTGYK